MTTTRTCATPTPSPCARYGTDKVDFGTKFLSELRDASAGQPWAKAILDAHRLPVNIDQLNPSGKQTQWQNHGQVTVNSNLNGLLQAGVRVTVPADSKDPTVKAQFAEWGKNLSQDFPGRQSYTPAQIGQLASNLLQAAKCLGASVKELSGKAEISSGDLGRWNQIVSALTGYGKAAETLHGALTNAPHVKSVQMDVSGRL